MILRVEALIRQTIAQLLEIARRSDDPDIKDCAQMSAADLAHFAKVASEPEPIRNHGNKFHCPTLVAAIRHTEGRAWLDVSTIGFELCYSQFMVMKDDQRLGADWAGANPVVRFANIKITEVVG